MAAITWSDLLDISGIVMRICMIKEATVNGTCTLYQRSDCHMSDLQQPWCILAIVDTNSSTLHSPC